MEQLEKRNTLRFFMAPPLVVMEVVSPGELQRDRDYIAKRMQYQDRGIPEYWIIDPQLQTVLVLKLVNNFYTEIGTFQGSDRIFSSQFTNINLTADQIFIASYQ
nr:Uma2 family endonuclease [Planktothrix paucivesiculata]